MLRYRKRRNRYFESNSPELERLLKDVALWKSWYDNGWKSFYRCPETFYRKSKELDDLLFRAKRLGADEDTLLLIETMSKDTGDIADELSYKLGKLMKEFDKWKSISEQGWMKFFSTSREFVRVNNCLNDLYRDLGELGVDEEILHSIDEMQDKVIAIAEAMMDDEMAEGWY